MLVIQRQLQDNWCWAACTATAAAFFNPSSRWSQCAIVNSELGECTCCEAGATGACDRPWYLERALKRAGNLAERKKGRLRWDDLTDGLDAGRPVGVRVGWSGGGGHFVLLTGCSERGGTRRVDVEDP